MHCIVGIRLSWSRCRCQWKRTLKGCRLKLSAQKIVRGNASLCIFVSEGELDSRLTQHEAREWSFSKDWDERSLFVLRDSSLGSITYVLLYNPQ